MKATTYTSSIPANTIHANYFDFAKAYGPVIEFNGEAVSISKGSTPKDIPILLFDSVQSSSAGIDTSGGSHVYFVADNFATVSCCTFTSISNGETLTVNPLFEYDGPVILELYPATYNNQYVITYKEGSCTKSNWLNNERR